MRYVNPLQMFLQSKYEFCPLLHLLISMINILTINYYALYLMILELG